MKETIRLSVTQTDIDLAQEPGKKNCPLNRAARRQLHLPADDSPIGSSNLLYRGNIYSCQTSATFADRFDNDQSVHPQDFLFEFEASLTDPRRI